MVKDEGVTAHTYIFYHLSILPSKLPQFLKISQSLLIKLTYTNLNIFENMTIENEPNKRREKSTSLSTTNETVKHAHCYVTYFHQY